MLTKSDLLSFRQCPRKLWLEKNPPAQMPANDSASRKLLYYGNAVGAKAREQLGNPLWPPRQANHEMAAQGTMALLKKSPGQAMVEVHMAHADLYARADALVPRQDGYALRETKASTFPLNRDGTAGDAEDHHLYDVAIQAWVMEGSELPMACVEINYLDNRWRYPGNNDYSGLFRQLDVTAAIEERKAEVPEMLRQAQAMLDGPMPEATTGKQCTSPYECPFIPFCKQREPAEPEHPIELLPGSAGKGLAKKLRAAKGYESILEPSPDELTGKQAGLFRRIQNAHRSGQAILEPGSDAIMKGFPYPRYYFDFEGIDLAIPLWQGTRAYEQIPFQWSCHIERSSSVFEHAEFLQLDGNDPSLPCIQRMREAINPADQGPIFVYHAVYERGRLEELAERHPEYTDLLNGYIGRLVDLRPIVENHFYHPNMQGSFSIKKVLPVIAPDLNYDDLDEIQGGTGAQDAFIEAALHPETTPERKAELENGLRTYCRQDTWALVELAYFLERKGRPARPRGM